MDILGGEGAQTDIFFFFWGGGVFKSQTDQSRGVRPATSLEEERKPSEARGWQKHASVGDPRLYVCQSSLVRLCVSSPCVGPFHGPF